MATFLLLLSVFLQLLTVSRSAMVGMLKGALSHAAPIYKRRDVEAGMDQKNEFKCDTCWDLFTQ